MSHPKIYETTRFYNDTVNEKARAWKKFPDSTLQESFMRSPPSSPSLRSPSNIASPSSRYVPAVAAVAGTRAEASCSSSPSRTQSPSRCRTPRFGEIGSALDLAYPYSSRNGLKYDGEDVHMCICR